MEKRREDTGENAPEIERERAPDAVTARRRAAAARLDMSPAARRRRRGGDGIQEKDANGLWVSLTRGSNHHGLILDPFI